jgi:hypothetical protein
MSRPSALAVLRLTTNSYFEACSTELAHRPARADKARPRALSRVSRVSAECAAPPPGDPPRIIKVPSPALDQRALPLSLFFLPPGHVSMSPKYADLITRRLNRELWTTPSTVLSL